MSGLPPTASSGFAVLSVSGRIRSPRPAARIIARRRTLMCRSDGPRGRELLERGLASLIDQLREWAELRIVATDEANISKRARDVVQIAGLPVPMPQTRKNPDRLQMSLHAHEVEPAQELRVARSDGNAGRARSLAKL